MKKIALSILIIFITAKCFSQAPQTPIVFINLNQMRAYAGSYFQAIVSNIDSNGVFTKIISSLPVDNTTFFACATSGYRWMRISGGSSGGGSGGILVKDSTVIWDGSSVDVEILHGRTSLPSILNVDVDDGSGTQDTDGTAFKYSFDATKVYIHYIPVAPKGTFVYSITTQQ